MPTYTVTGYQWAGFTTYPTSFSIVIDDDDAELDWFGGDTGAPQTATFGGNTYTIAAAGLLPSDIQNNDGGEAVLSEELLFLNLTGNGWVFVPMPGSVFTDGDAINNWTAPVGWSDTDGVEHTAIVCFTTGSKIETPSGRRRIEDLAIGDMVITKDGGPKQVRWLAKSSVSSQKLATNPKLRPVLIPKDAIAPGIPAKDSSVSRQHRILLHNTFPGTWGDDEFFAPAVALARSGLARIEKSCEPVTYVHLLLEDHHVLCCDGLASESFFPGRIAIASLAEAARSEFETLFPNLNPNFGPAMQAARKNLSARKAAEMIG